MPRYKYKCTNCDVLIDTWHGMSEEEQIKNCEFCGGVNCMKGMPPSFSYESAHSDKPKKVGDITKHSIESFREDLNTQKEKLQNELWDPDS